MSTPVPKKPFKVIVIGAGVTGLTLSHALNKAKIEHVVLERGDIAPLQGSSIGIHPHGCRILDQLGCLQDVERLCVPMKQFVNRLPNGQLLSRSDFFDFIAKR
jgi:2-polyprenyl-6-methoxyphenol hydroxylase-like FAD-dependent oxidoreductase